MPDAPNTPTPASKRLAVFLDGTWNTQPDNTNVWRLRSLCAPRGADGIDQCIYYNTGLGTKVGEKVLGGFIGKGINDNIIEAYEWLIEHYNPGDKLFIFGFSRGAYTARALSGLICKFGLLLPGAPISTSQLYARYRLGGEPKTIRALHDEAARGHIPASNEERWLLKYSQPIDVDFIGVWDTVGAVTKKETQFLHTGLRIPIQYAFHALALDEHRRRFAPTIWTVDVPKDAKVSIAKPRTLEQVEQRWFAGAHANIGGGYPDDLLAQLPLKWLLEKAALQGLAFRANVDLDGDPTKSPVIDSYGQMLRGFYRLITLFQPFYRPIEETSEDATSRRRNVNETIDASVFQRWAEDESYRPKNLAQWAQRHKLDLSKIVRSVHADDPAKVV